MPDNCSTISFIQDDVGDRDEVPTSSWTTIATSRTKSRMIDFFFYIYSFTLSQIHTLSQLFSSLFSSKIKMNPHNFPNSNCADDDMPMFGGGGGGGGAHWPGHEDYRVQTPGSVGSAMDPDTEFDPFFDTTAYIVEEMELSCGQPLTPTPKTRKKMMARKNKAPVVPLLTSEVNNEYAEGRMDYEEQEYKTLAQCWINIMEDAIVSNNQPGRWY